MTADRKQTQQPGDLVAGRATLPDDEAAFLDRMKQTQSDFAARWLRDVSPTTEPAVVLDLARRDV